MFELVSSARYYGGSNYVFRVRRTQMSFITMEFKVKIPFNEYPI